ncbi:MAG TPA: isoaspartyl peptidase/L-asparaginase family protein [Nitrospiria bacterium]|nr:isoaspartyl peptidase/L-asparaginase family protein [Nitrospiria bacterium]
MTRRRFSPVFLVHGGCGGPPASKRQLQAIRDALSEGYSLLLKGEGAIEAVEKSIRFLEESGFFNAGRGGKLQLDGHLRLDASLMEGKRLRAGGVAGIEGIRSPVSAARKVLEESPHVLLIGEGAARFGRFHKLAKMTRPSLQQIRLHEELLRSQDPWMKRFHSLIGTGTVGATALDRSGTLAAGASTGGVNRMLPGRVGDTPLIGAGVYADDRSGAVSMTGEGEGIIRAGSAREITLRLEFGATPRAAATLSLRRMKERTQCFAGALILSKRGSFAIVHTTAHMIGGFRVGRRMKVADRFEVI